MRLDLLVVVLHHVLALVQVDHDAFKPAAVSSPPNLDALAIMSLFKSDGGIDGSGGLGSGTSADTAVAAGGLQATTDERSRAHLVW